MRLNKELQIAILTCLYLARSGRTKTYAITEEFGISKKYFDIVVQKLRKAGIVKAYKGPGGGYELTHGATLKQVISVMTPPKFLSREEYDRYVKGSPEQRALAHIAHSMGMALHPLLARTMTLHMMQLVGNEVSLLNNMNEYGMES